MGLTDLKSCEYCFGASFGDCDKCDSKSGLGDSVGNYIFEDTKAESQRGNICQKEKE